MFKAHSLTVTRLAWSSDDKLLVSVGRDRQWSLFDTEGWKVVKTAPKGHAPIIWDVSFAPGEFGWGVSVAASRDKIVKVWDGRENWGCVVTIKFSEAVTPCAVLGDIMDG